VITVLGAQGFIGRNLAAYLRNEGEEVYCPQRSENFAGRYLGTVFYCIGLTGDFKDRIYDTVEAHVCCLNKLLRDNDIKKIIYLSSARVYFPCKMTVVTEDALIPVSVFEPNEIYNISKIMGESLLLSASPNALIVRLSNVYGQDMDSNNFLGTLIEQSITNKHITINSTPHSAKDYVAIDDVVKALFFLEKNDKIGIWNISAGANISNEKIAFLLKKELGCSSTFRSVEEEKIYPKISNKKLLNAGYLLQSSLEKDLPQLINFFEKQRRNSK
jgi:nucleoside-diphosphate-sugar epimerase